MNCKPGDLARIIDTPGTRHAGLVDRFIRVTTTHVGDRDLVVWCYEGALLRCRCGCGLGIQAFADEVLRPIRDPGPDAVDETLVGKTAPVLEEVSA